MKDKPLVLKKEKESPSEPGIKKEPWKILIVDDDKDVHDVTVFALKDIKIQERSLTYFHAYSGREAVKMMKENPDIAVILMDAVMESDDAGLLAVRSIRQELKMESVRIILRTGQPGQVPELETITRFDIDGYKTKSELTRTKLVTILYTALRSWEQIQRLNRNRLNLEKIVKSGNELFAEEEMEAFTERVISRLSDLFDLPPEGITCLSVPPGEFSFSDESRCRTSLCRIIAARKPFLPLKNQFLQDVEEQHIRESLLNALKEETHQFRNEGLAVFFRGAGGKKFATWINSREPLQNLDNHLLEVFCTNLSLSASNIELVSRLKKQAWEDPFLKIPNRNALLEKINSYLKGTIPEGLELILLDIDGFNRINDLLGHDYGDEILKSLTENLKTLCRNNGFLARIGSDIFGLIQTREEISEKTLRELTSLSIPSPDGMREMSLSIGIAAIDRKVVSGSEVVRNGYVALKQAKKQGLGQIVSYNQKIGMETRERLHLLEDLRAALTDNKLYLVFQPQANMADRKVFCFEALIRWKNSDGVFIPPDKFIPIAEQSGLIIPIGYWVLRMALIALKEIKQAGHPDMKMAVNVSPMQLRQNDFLSHMDRILTDLEVSPEDLELEITESISIMGEEEVKERLQAIRNRGISLAIDDFGTGYSSLSSIDHWPVNRLKIDKSFISHLEEGKEDIRLVGLVIPLGQKLSLQVLAEGVETEWQLNRLKELGCHEMQGYHLARPMELPDLLKWLEDN